MDNKKNFKGGKAAGNGKPQGGRKPQGGKPSDNRRGGYRGKSDGPKREGSYKGRSDSRSGKPQGDKRNFKREDSRGGKRDFKLNDNRSPRSDERKSSGFRGFENTHNRPARSLGYRPGQAPKKKPGMKTKTTPARLLAYEVLTYIRENDCYLTEAIDKLVTYADKPAPERAFARLLATEVVSRKGSLDQLINSVLNSPEDVQPEVRDALRMGFCEAFYLKKPDHVVVDQGVELVRSVAPGAAGLANFALHRAIELREEFPFGNPDEDVKAAALENGFPEWLAARLADELGPVEARRFMQRSNNPAPLFFMLNLANVNGPKALQTMVSRGVKVVPVQAPEGLPLAFPAFGFAERTAVRDEYVAELLANGSLIVSDMAAQCIASLALPKQQPKRFLEVGAGRGTKTIMLQNAALSRYGKQMTFDTLDIDPKRTKEREKQLVKANIHQEQAIIKDARNLSDLEAEAYDAVFVDAPCSGIGTLRRHADIRWRMTEEEVSGVAQTALEILQQAARLVARGGQLTYATCTVLKEENQDVIESFLASEAGKGFTVVTTLQTDALYREKVDGPIYDTHYCCVLRRA